MRLRFIVAFKLSLLLIQYQNNFAYILCTFLLDFWQKFIINQLWFHHQNKRQNTFYVSRNSNHVSQKYVKYVQNMLICFILQLKYMNHCSREVIAYIEHFSMRPVYTVQCTRIIYSCFVISLYSLFL